MMAHDLDTLIMALLPPTCAVHLTKVTMEHAAVRLELTATTPTATCPRCTMSSSSIHHRYQRHLTNLPWGTHTVRLCQHSRHKGEANAVDRSNPVYAAATMLISWANRS
jgi:transposase